MIPSNILARAGLLSALTACALLASGCGGSSTGGDTLGKTQSSGPVVVGVDQNVLGAEVSGLVKAADPAQPTADDVAYDTTATAIAVLNGQPPLTGADSYTGAADYYDGTPNTAAVPAGTTVQFRAYIVNGQNGSSRAYIPIQSVVLTSADPQAAAAGFTAKPLALAFRTDSSAAGPLASATFATAPFPLPFTTNGPHTFSVTITDTSGQSSRTDFTTQVAAAGSLGVAIRNVDTGTLDMDKNPVLAALAPGDTATLTSAAGVVQKATADDAGTAYFFATPGTYTLVVNTTMDPAPPATDPVPVTYTQTLDLTKAAPGSTFSQVRKAHFKKH